MRSTILRTTLGRDTEIFKTKLFGFGEPLNPADEAYRTMGEFPTFRTYRIFHEAVYDESNHFKVISVSNLYPKVLQQPREAQ